jgi:cell division transport system permease protein
LRAYFANHKASAWDALRRLLVVPGQTLPTCLVIAIALALPALLFLALDNLSGQTQQWRSPVQMSAFLLPGARDRSVQGLVEELSVHPVIANINYLAPDAAMREFQEASGLGDVLASLPENPLPGVLVIEVESVSSEALQALQNTIAEAAIVDFVQLDLAWVERLGRIIHLAERVVLGLTLLLGVGVILVTGNIIRLAITHRKDEIVIAKLVGASDGFVRRPFLYTGAWYGLLGGLLALLMVALAFSWLRPAIDSLVAAYGREADLQGLGWSDALGLVFGAAVLGCLGAWMSVARHLRAIRPT